MLRIAVDFDGTIVAAQAPLAFLPGAADGLRALKLAGHYLILHSARCTPMDAAPAIEEEAGRFYETGEVPARAEDSWARFSEMREFLRGAGTWDLFDDVWQAPGKPMADLFVDDRAESPDWRVLAETLGRAPTL
jgi:hypothetical protein